ncbi:MAG: WecB/TagA/CpsF family glycosyltransferase [Lachnospiraceae bacterium]|nr:WecB/TagA/CpsF family glycosyltransferase [Lachnospiraceae bacterium]
MKFCQVLGVKTVVSQLEEGVTLVCDRLESLKGQYITFANTHSVVMAAESPRFLKVQEAATITFADGFPIAKYQRWKGFAKAERVAGPDFMTEIFKRSGKEGYSHYFYGSSNETLRALKENLENKYPGIHIKGMYSPPYGKRSKEEWRKDLERINASGADFIWIGLGAPKQELFMYRQRGKACGLMLGVGAGFDFHAGVQKRAPLWMQRWGLEWFYRLMQEPDRLWKRYLVTNIKFLFLCIKYAGRNEKEL